jgi:glycosidase
VRCSIEQAIWWHVYPLGFVGAERESGVVSGVQHRFGKLVAWLDYAVNLGASGLLLGPVFASSTYGYDTIDHFRIDPRLGDEADFEAFISSARQRGLRVILDGVFNHVGRDCRIFRRALAGGPGSREASWFRLTWPQDWIPGREPDYAMFEGHRQLVTLNHDEPAVAEYVTSVMNHWLDLGADGWRLDAAYAVPRHFWKKVLPLARARHPDAYIFGEVIHGDYAGFVRETGINAVTQYELWKAIWSALNDRNFLELAWALNRHNAGGDDAIRPEFPATPPDLASFGWPTYRLYQELIGLRWRHSWLHRARSRTIEVRNTDFVFEAFDEGNRLWVALNVADAPVSRTIDACVAGSRGTLWPTERTERPRSRCRPIVGVSSRSSVGKKSSARRFFVSLEMA